MTGERDLTKLCEAIRPVMQAAIYVYCCFHDFVLLSGLEQDEVFFTFRESEGLTVVLQNQTAERLALPFLSESRLVTLDVHPSLEAVGFIATIATVLADAKIPCNAVAAYYHDHLLIPVSRTDEAITLLERMRDAACVKLLVC
ncbi:ACT domain-containing protein [Burkholderia multivorans]|uniref:ACT domain-containing protein n=1 Tax=Burkholderia multivorans TaxID=87883 RepID=UPI0021BFE519|nr:ACT domain-containing protein [Burkholderia multivorans]HDR9188790.1 ACT domain-containing protein [Burkholderia vietnamiensis]MDR8763427.1 hypothetical protein [Burkholderia multivorans]MDR8769028.1 hypothetical protein [Burkholderia multivorans]MDR8774997.1 hypothetical protein [Burkholderia multivorans]MDR8792554.1 hypothetical protein [Burkholderia multivorans]